MFIKCMGFCTSGLLSLEVCCRIKNHREIWNIYLDLGSYPWIMFWLKSYESMVFKTIML